MLLPDPDDYPSVSFPHQGKGVLRNTKLPGFPLLRERRLGEGADIWARNPDEQSAELSIEFGLGQKITNRRAQRYCL